VVPQPSPQQQPSQHRPKTREGYQSNFSKSGYITDASSVYAGNVPYGVKQEKLEEVFSAFGKIKSINMEQVQKKGFAFIEFENPDSVKTLIRSAHESPLRIEERVIAIEEKKTKGSFYGYQRDGRDHRGPRPNSRTSSSSSLTSTLSSSNGTAEVSHPPTGYSSRGRGSQYNRRGDGISSGGRGGFHSRGGHSPAGTRLMKSSSSSSAPPTE